MRFFFLYRDFFLQGEKKNLAQKKNLVAKIILLFCQYHEKLFYASEDIFVGVFSCSNFAKSTFGTS